jgi:uncharacterized protein YegP (UPF0339 family)
MKVMVIDKDTGKTFWTEKYETKEAVVKAMEHLKENHFNPKYFTYKLVKA